MEIDLNADLGEGAGFDAELMPLVTSANVCCGLHAGGPVETAKTLALAREHSVVVGAHPGYADRENFGRVEQSLSSDDVYCLCLYQLGAICALACEIHYVKPHGALYNQACRNRDIASAIIEAAEGFNALPVVGLPKSQLEVVAKERNHPFIPE